MNEVSTNPALVRIEAIEAELATLRKKLKGPAPEDAKVTLDGVWKDITVSDDEIADVKNGWVKKFDDIV